MEVVFIQTRRAVPEMGDQVWVPNMKLEDFQIGTEFLTCTGQRWRCTDVGGRSILAIELQQNLDPAWWAGPPYAVPEVPFDEIAIARAYRTLEDATVNALKAVDRGAHPGYPHDAVETMMKARFPDASRRYPRKGLFRIDRVDPTGEILHPFAAEPVDGGWSIRTYLPFCQQFRLLPEADFIRFRPANEADLRRRAKKEP